jgi:hypothetical protein
MAQQSARRGRMNQVYSSCPEHAFMIWFRSANSHAGPQLYRCIRGRTDGSIRLRADLLQKPLASPGASTDEYRPINPVSIPTLRLVLQYFFEIFRNDKNYRSKRSKKLDADAPKVKFYKPKKGKIKIV